MAQKEDQPQEFTGFCCNIQQPLNYSIYALLVVQKHYTPIAFVLYTVLAAYL